LLTGTLEPHERAADRVADVETRARAAVVPLMPPAHVALQLIDRVEASALDQALGKAQRHRRVVGPFARPELERAAANHGGDWRERARALALARGPPVA